VTAITDAIARERAFQRCKYGGTAHDLSLWVLIMERELAEVKEAIIKKTFDDARMELLQVVAVGVAALEQHGVVERETVRGDFVVERFLLGTPMPDYFHQYVNGKAVWTARESAYAMSFAEAVSVKREEQIEGFGGATIHIIPVRP
jgi:hypothetical protein